MAMKFVDANYLLRLFLWDIPEQARQAEAELDRCHRGEVVVIEAVIEECCFVLTSPRTFGMSHKEVREGLVMVLSKSCFDVSSDIFVALEMFATHPKLDFVDCLLAVKTGGKRGNLLTFDTELQRALR